MPTTRDRSKQSTMTTPLIETCPPEIVESFVKHLDIVDIANVRLTSRCMATLATQDTYKSYFQTKKVVISKSGLERFRRITAGSALASLVQNLTVVGLAVDTSLLEKILAEKARWITESHGPMFSSHQQKCTPEELEETQVALDYLRNQRAESTAMKQSGEDVKLLTEAFENIAAMRPGFELNSLELSVNALREVSMEPEAPVQGAKWETIWRAAGDCFQVVMQALQDSQLAVNSLNCYDSTWRCSLALDEIHKPERPARRFADALKGLKTLRLSISETPQYTSESQPGEAEDADDSNGGKGKEDITPAAVNDMNTLEQFLGLVPELERLDIHWYRIGYQKPEWEPLQAEGMFNVLKDEGTHLPKLANLRLRGVRITEEALLKLLMRHPLKELSMEQLSLTQGDAAGTFTAIFQYCTSDEAMLENIYFDDLFESKQIYFSGVGQPKYPRSGRHDDGPTLKRKSENMRKPIKYHLAQGRMLGSPQAYRYRQITQREYGPP